MTISGSFPGDSELISSFPAQKRAEGDTLLVDHTATGTHNKVSLTDRDGSTPTGIPANVLAIWQEDEELFGRVGSGAVRPLAAFIPLTEPLLAQAADNRPVRVLRADGETRRIAFVNASNENWGFLGINSAGALIITTNNGADGTPASVMDFQPGGILNVSAGELRVANNVVLHAGNFTSIIPAAPTAAGAVGTYVFAARVEPTIDIDFGDVVNGSSLVPIGMLSNTDIGGESTGSRNGVEGSAVTLSGTWQCMGFSRRTNDLSNITQSATLWLRIS